LPTGRAARNANTDGNAFGVVVVAGVVLAGRVRMQEESSAPHTRLGYIHLHSSFNNSSRAISTAVRQNNSRVHTGKEKTGTNSELRVLMTSEINVAAHVERRASALGGTSLAV
jgi:hypothetical protein